ncbi:MAG: hypothetical protein WC740_17905 [Verrucomicrobiia bacterium]
MNLYGEMSKRFPEVSDAIQQYEDLPYVLMGQLASWVAKKKPQELTPELISRIVEFAKWCEEQPRDETAEDDLFTILVVGFYESLFKSDTTRLLLPKLILREDIVYNAEYIKTWVGEENYNKALALYGSNT